MSKIPYKILTLHDFKAKISEYIHRLDEGREHYVLRRYKKNVALVLSLALQERNSKANDALAQLALYRATVARHAEQRRLIRARLLSWPGHKR